MKFDGEIAGSILKCPVCGAETYIDGVSIFCRGAKKHCFDISSGGYVNLARSNTPGGDSAESVRARTSFLQKDYYKPAAEQICRAVEKYVRPGGVIIDAGCGEGYYSNMLAGRGFRVAGFDLSKYACMTAAKRSAGKTGYAVASVYALPVFDGCADAVVNVFAPCVPSEYFRVLKPGGVLIVAGAGSDHLIGLKKALYDSVYENTQRADLPKIAPDECISERFEIAVDGCDIPALFSMTPYYWRTSRGDASKLDGLETLTTAVNFEIKIYKKDIRSRK